MKTCFYCAAQALLGRMPLKGIIKSHRLQDYNGPRKMQNTGTTAIAIAGPGHVYEDHTSSTKRTYGHRNHQQGDSLPSGSNGLAQNLYKRVLIKLGDSNPIYSTGYRPRVKFCLHTLSISWISHITTLIYLLIYLYQLHEQFRATDQFAPIPDAYHHQKRSNDDVNLQGTTATSPKLLQLHVLEEPHSLSILKVEAYKIAPSEELSLKPPPTGSKPSNATTIDVWLLDSISS